MRYRFATTLFCLLAVACTVSAPAQDSATVAVDSLKADSLGEVRIRAAGMTIWAQPDLALQEYEWVFRARSSYNLASVNATIDGVSETAVVLTSPRKFEATMTLQQTALLMDGGRLLIDLTTTSGKSVTMMVGARTRSIDFGGSSSLYIWKNAVPVYVAGNTLMRARVTTSQPMVDLMGLNDDDSEPEATQLDPTHWTLQWWPSSLLLASAPQEDTLLLRATSVATGEVYSKNISFYLTLREIGLTDADPSTVWPAYSCTTAVQNCLDTLQPGADTEVCGLSYQVRPCAEDAENGEQEEIDLRPQFANDLRDALFAYYAQYGDDIIASGGNTQQQALLLVDTADMQELADTEEDPAGHDFENIRVLSHPDFAFPGSDTMWFGAYERQTNELVEVYSFN